ncbi:MAG: hypothetical protein MEQ84_02570 [Mesorhizobium sp.]|nr:hypothetical protein [Mesorhizobium sp.]
MDRNANNDDSPHLTMRDDQFAQAEFEISHFLPGLDTIAFFGAIIFLEYSGLVSFGLLAMQPHPFWLPILLAVVQYGTAQGVTAIAIALALEWALGWTEPAIGADYYDYLFQNLREPLLWLVAVGVLGAIRQRHQDRSDAFEAESRKRRSQATVLANHCKSLRQEVATLEHTVAATGPARAAKCMQLLDELSSTAAHRLNEVFADVLFQLLGAEGVEIITFERGEIARPREIDGGRSLPLVPQGNSLLPAPIMDTLRHERRTLSCIHPADSQVLSALRTAVVAPIPGPQGNIIGAVMIREVDPSCLSPGGAAALSLSCFILGQQLSRGRPAIVDVDLAARGGMQNVRPLHRMVGSVDS